MHATTLPCFQLFEINHRYHVQTRFPKIVPRYLLRFEAPARTLAEAEIAVKAFVNKAATTDRSAYVLLDNWGPAASNLPGAAAYNSLKFEVLLDSKSHSSDKNRACLAGYLAAQLGFESKEAEALFEVHIPEAARVHARRYYSFMQASNAGCSQAQLLSGLGLVPHPGLEAAAAPEIADKSEACPDLDYFDDEDDGTGSGGAGGAEADYFATSAPRRPGLPAEMTLDDLGDAWGQYSPG